MTPPMEINIERDFGRGISYKYELRKSLHDFPRRSRHIYDWVGIEDLPSLIEHLYKTKGAYQITERSYWYGHEEEQIKQV